MEDRREGHLKSRKAVQRRSPFGGIQEKGDGKAGNELSEDKSK